MTVLVTMKVEADTDQFRRFLAQDPERLQEFAASAQAAGAIHHRFGLGDGYFVVVDEWDSVESFQSFMSRDEITAILRDTGARSAPEIDITQVVVSPDQL